MLKRCFAVMMFILATQCVINFAQAAEAPPGGSAVTIVEHVDAKQLAEEMPKAQQSLKEMAEGLLVTLIEKATQAGEFVADQIPLVIRELLLFNAVSLAVVTGIGIALFCFGGYLGSKLLEWQSTLPSEYTCREATKHDWPRPVVWMISCGLCTPGFFIFILNVDDLLKITLAPRVWLIEYAAQLVR